MVFFKVTNFGLQESVALRIQRRWPLVGPWLGRTGKRMADTPSVGTRASFLFLRRIALRTIGGETQFTPDEVIARYTTCIRGIVARESIMLVVRGTDGGRVNPGLGPKAAAIREAGRLRVHFAMKSLCEGARVTYYGREKSRSAEEHARLIGPDGLHRLAAGQQLAGEDDGRMMVRAWREAHGGGVAVAASADRA